MTTREDEFEELAREVEGRNFGHFTVRCDVVVDAPTGRMYIAVMVINNRNPDSLELPTIDLPKGWIVSDYWYQASAAGVQAGSIEKAR